jgi:GT2 family glycosyltransferase
MTATVSFLIVNYFTSGMVRTLAASIRLHCRAMEYEILVCDNSADPAEFDALRSIEGLRVDVPAENLGFVKANNRLFAQAKNRVIVAINPDTVLTDNSLERLIDLVSDDRSIGVAGPKLLNQDGTDQQSCYQFPTLRTLIVEIMMFGAVDPYRYSRNLDHRQSVDVVKGACLVFRKEVFPGDGFFDERFVMYSEEVDLCRRLRTRGLDVVYVPETVIIHYGEQSSKTKRASLYSLFHYYRSKIVYFDIHSGTDIRPVIVLLLIWKILVFMIMLKFTAAAEHYRVAMKLFRRQEKFV